MQLSVAQGRTAFLVVGLGAIAPDAAGGSGADSNDTYFGASWDHRVLGSQAAWAIPPGSPDVIVAVIDTGVDADHPDLAGRVIEGWNLRKHSTDTSPTSWHGTGVAGVIAAVRDTGRGVAGLADVSIMPVVPSAGDVLNAVAALAWPINPDLMPVQVRDLLFDTAVDLGPPGWGEQTGHGRLDLAAAGQAPYATVPEPGVVSPLFLAGTWVFWRRRPAGKVRSMPNHC